MSNILEKSLDDIIGENRSKRRSAAPPRKRGGRGGSFSSRPSSLHYRSSSYDRHPYRRPPPDSSRQEADVYIPRSSSSSSNIPRDVLQLAGGRPTLRLRNIHPELNGQDLNNLFSTINDVDFIKFDDENDTIAYICFQNDCERSNTEAIAKYDGKKAMGQILGVENANVVSLAERITLAPISERIRARSRSPPPRRDGRGGRGGRDGRGIAREDRGGPRGARGNRSGRGGRGPRGPRSGNRGDSNIGASKKTAEDLDKELNDYMGVNNGEESNGGNNTERNGNAEGRESNGQNQDGMTLD